MNKVNSLFNAIISHQRLPDIIESNSKYERSAIYMPRALNGSALRLCSPLPYTCSSPMGKGSTQSVVDSPAPPYCRYGAVKFSTAKEVKDHQEDVYYESFQLPSVFEGVPAASS